MLFTWMVMLAGRQIIDITAAFMACHGFVLAYTNILAFIKEFA
jgi:hypothetical protein